MNKEKFSHLVETHTTQVLGLLARKGFETADAEDIVADAVVRLLANQSYRNCETEGHGVALLTRAVQMTATDFQRSQRVRQSGCIQETDTGVVATVEVREVPDVFDAEACPFCHVGVLNQYSACVRCRTILGKVRGPRRHRTRLEEVGLTVTTDFALKSDVEQAIAKLSGPEQAVVRHVLQGNESLESLSELTGLPKTSLWRIFVQAKGKLAGFLFEYAEQPCAVA